MLEQKREHLLIVLRYTSANLKKKKKKKKKKKLKKKKKKKKKSFPSDPPIQHDLAHSAISAYVESFPPGQQLNFAFRIFRIIRTRNFLQIVFWFYRIITQCDNIYKIYTYHVRHLCVSSSREYCLNYIDLKSVSIWYK